MRTLSETMRGVPTNVESDRTPCNPRSGAGFVLPHTLVKARGRLHHLGSVKAASPSKAVENVKRSIFPEPKAPEANLHATDLQEPEHEAQQPKFDWAKAWYPVAVVADLPTDRPTPVRLLGNPVVLWKDGEGVWRAFRDLCPHRLAPLSEGRVENGELQCSYHGWQFRGSDGRATVIPQATDDKAMATAVASRRSCVAPYPCVVQDGLVWVWPSCAPEAQQEAGSKPIGSSPKHSDDSCRALIPWFMRELPYGADVLSENVLDPSHVPFSHHGVQGNRYKVTKMVMKLTEEVTAKKGFCTLSTIHGEVPKGTRPVETKLSFHPPSLVRYQFVSGAEMVVHSVPTDPGRSRIFFQLLLPKSQVSRVMGFTFGLFSNNALRWFDHLTRNKVLDGDNVFLAAQDEELRARGAAAADYAEMYYMPTSLDRAVMAFRAWFAHHATPFPWGPAAKAPPTPANRSRQELLNRFEQHTQHCPSCSAAHRVFSKLQQVGTYAALIGTAFAAFSLTSGAPLRTIVLAALATAASAAVAAISANFRGKLEFQDYRHPDH